MVDNENPMALISVIVPVYKAEGFVGKCIESILNQTYRHFQLIMVDDGSPDSSGVICDQFAKQDSRMIVIHTSNRGVSAARNEGISLANGEFIAFVDSDDYIDRDFFAKAMECIEGQGIDMYLSGLRMETFDNEVMTQSVINRGKDGIYSVRELFETFNGDYPFMLVCGVWCKLYRTDLINRHNIRFDVSMSLGEDMVFNCDYLEHSDRVTFSSDVFYHFIRGNAESLFSRYYPDMYDINVPIYDRVRSLMLGRGCSREAIRKIDSIYVKTLVGCIYHEYNFLNKSTPQSRKVVINKVINNRYVHRCPIMTYSHPEGIAILLLLKLKASRLLYRLFTARYCRGSKP